MKAHHNTNAIIEWLFKALLSIVLWLVKDMREDIKNMREQMPAMKVEIENLKDQRLLDKFKSMKVYYYMKEEPIITFDSLTKNRSI